MSGPDGYWATASASSRPPASAGVLTLEQALILAETRGRLMDGLEERGTMAAVQATADEVEDLHRSEKDRASASPRTTDRSPS